MRSIRFTIFCCLTSALAPLGIASAQVATKTVLTLSTPGTVAAGTTETLTAQVFDSSNGTISRGRVNFFDGARLLGSGQIITRGSGPIGSAVIHSRFGAGSHSVTAKFAGVTGLGSGSQSVVQNLTVTPSTSGGVTPTYAFNLPFPSYYPPYTLTATITANVPSAPAGFVVFKDTYSGSDIASVPLVAGPAQNAGFVQGSAPIAPAVPLFDYNNDGILDILSIDISTRVVSLALGNSDGTFKAPTILYTPNLLLPLVVADFNADGNLDVLASDTLLLGKGDGTFTQGPPLPNYGSSTTTGDYDHDGAADYAFIAGGMLMVCYGNGDGTFQAPIAQGSISDNIPYSASATADLNGDGIDDVVASVFHGDGVFGNDLVVLLSNGNRTFQPYKPVNAQYSGARASTPFPADINGDGIIDLVYSRPTYANPLQSGSAVYVNLGVGDGTFRPGVDVSDPFLQNASGAIVGDFNGDGKLDLAVGANSAVNFLFGKGDGTFAPNPGVGPYPNLGSLAVGDLNGDGVLDVVTGTNTLIGSATSTASATLSNVMVPGGGTHWVYAQYSPDGITALTTTTVPLMGIQSNTIDSTSGFTPALGLHLNGSAALNGTMLRLTDGKPYEAGSAWSSTPLYMRSFTTGFDFQITNPDADGFTLTLQNSAPTALGTAGGELGFNFIPNSVALKFDLYNNAGEGQNSVGVYTAGSTLTGPGTMLPSTIDLHSGHPFNALVVYNGSRLTLSLIDFVTQARYTFIKDDLDLVKAIGTDYAYIGFTGATGGLTSTTDILDWFYTPVAGVSVPDSSAPLVANGSATSSSSTISLVDGGQNEAGSVWTGTPVNINDFDVKFTASVQNNTNGPAADGFTFTVQNSSPNALGTGGGELGFNFIPNSVAFKFDLFDNAGEGANSIGLFQAGETLTGPSTILPAGMNLVGTNNYEIKYDGTTLTVIINPNMVGNYRYTRQVNLRDAVKGNSAYIGFTAGTGASTSIIQIPALRYSVGIE